MEKNKIKWQITKNGVRFRIVPFSNTILADVFAERTKTNSKVKVASFKTA